MELCTIAICNLITHFACHFLQFTNSFNVRLKWTLYLQGRREMAAEVLENRKLTLLITTYNSFLSIKYLHRFVHFKLFCFCIDIFWNSSLFIFDRWNFLEARKSVYVVFFITRLFILFINTDFFIIVYYRIIYSLHKSTHV